MSTLNVNETYWAIIDENGNLHSGESGRINGFYTTEKRAQAFKKREVERCETMVLMYISNEAVSKMWNARFENTQTWRIVPVKISESCP